ncbi:FAD-binding oxidoreductase [Nonomuraea africana]|uniref:Glycolate oxidase FAD binding subunit n=1 Tax=Nonomuraea africana TaxID=46171 RepID=A0ABR9KK50_9ACTN|nr:FAD-binding oxidoreductase [Nonomuraea africana]MBE1562401.1 glycolate oxidase FAD binding subunit [Nonomuraea africana]
MPSGVTVRQAGADDEVAGVRPTWVALPETTEEVAAVLSAAAEHDLAVVPVGGGSKLHWGPPPERCDVLLDTCCLNQVLEHAEGDLVVRTQAGVTMEALADTLAARGQELALDVQVEGATVGGTLATALPGPRSFRYGGARDLLIGITVVLADGTVARSGGKVVKNVAGYDLGKLFTGSYGTLGVIAEATFRLHPLASERRWIRARLPVRPAVLLQALAAAQAEPTAIEINQAGDDAHAELAVLVEGSAAEPRAEAVAALMPNATVSAEPPSWWGALPGGDVLMELRFPPSQGEAALEAVHGLGATVRGSLASGILWLALSPSEGLSGIVAALRSRLAEVGGRVSVLAAPYEEGLDRWGEIGALPLMRRVKERFDPGRRLSPGRFVGGI